MNFNAKAHVDHNLEAHNVITKVYDVMSIDISPDPHNPTALAKVETAYRSRRSSQQPQLYCRTCDLFLTNWTLNQ